MNEIQAILNLAQKEAGQPMALATVVDLQGSAYRHPGARMLVTASGQSAGMISGGCLESDVKERAIQVMSSSKPLLVTYDSLAPEDIVFGMGLGCNGLVRILIELFPHDSGEGLSSFMKTCSGSLTPGRLATVFMTKDVLPGIATGAHLMLWPDGNITTDFEDSVIRNAIAASPHLDSKKRATVQDIAMPDGGTLRVFFENIAAPVSLLILGAGEDAVPLARFAGQLGWRVTLVDSRPACALPERFPGAEAVMCLRPEEIPRSLFLPGVLVMIMTHNYGQDKELLRIVLQQEVAYAGILGPKARTLRLLDELTSDGMMIPERNLSRLHGPAGLDIGAGGPAEVAISIVAEMQAVLTGHAGGQLRLRDCGIHEVKA